MATSTLARSQRRARRSRRTAAPSAPMVVRDWIIFGAAVVGLLVSAYLLLLDLTGGSAVCVAGADCDIVRASVYGRVFGLPMALLGVAYFLAVGLTALLRASWQPRLLQLLGGVGLGAATLFIVVQGLVLQAWCPYCLMADGAALAVGMRASWPRGGQTDGQPDGQPGVLRSALVRGVAGAALAVTVLLFGYAAGLGVSSATAASSTILSTSTAGPEAARLAALADHLRESGAVFYGAYWCPHCQNQKAMFGAAASKLPYVECDPRGTGARPAACQAAGVRVFPTWVIGGQIVEGEVPIDELARLSGFTQ